MKAGRGLTLLMVLSTSCLLLAPPAMAEEDKLYNYLLRFADAIHLFQQKKFKEAEPLANKLVEEAARDGFDKPGAAAKYRCPSGLDKVTPLLRIPRAAGDIYKRVYIEMLELRGTTRTANNHLVEGLADLEKAMELCPRFAEGRVGLALHYRQKKEYDKALSEIDKALKLDPKLHHAFYTRALIYHDMGKPDLEAQAYAESEKLAAQEGLQLSDFMDRNTARDGSVNQAGATRLIEVHPLSAGAIATYAENINRQRPEDALKYANIAIALSPDQPFGYFTRADVYLDLGKFKEAAADANKALTIQPDSLDMRISRSLAYLNINRLDDALADLNTVIQRAPDWTDAYTYRSAVYIARGEYKKALVDGKKAVTVDPDYSMAYNNLGICYARLNLLEDARHAFETAVRLERKTRGYAGPLLRFNLGSIYQRLNKIEMANKEYDNVLIADPVFPVRMFSKAATAAQLGCRDEEIKQSLRTGIPPGIPFLDRERMIDTASVLSRLIVLAPRKSESRFNRALANLCLNQCDTANVDLRQFLNFKSPHSDKAALLSYLCADRKQQVWQGRKELKKSMKQFKSPALTALGRFFLGETSEEQVLQQVKDNADGTTVHSLLGFYYLTRDVNTKAKQHIEWTLLKGDRETAEYILALSELEHLCKQQRGPATSMAP